VQLDAKAGIERARDHSFAAHLEHPGRRKPAHQGLAHARRVGPGLGGEQQRLRHRLDGEGDDDLVRDLGRLTVTAAADERDVLAHDFEQGLDPIVPIRKGSATISACQEQSNPQERFDLAPIRRIIRKCFHRTNR
jgi:hypothetical protein